MCAIFVTVVYVASANAKCVDDRYLLREGLGLGFLPVEALSRWWKEDVKVVHPFNHRGRLSYACARQGWSIGLWSWRM